MKVALKVLRYGFLFIAPLSYKTPCECEEVPEQSIEFKLLNSQGQNLVFGSQALYRVDSIRLLANRNSFSTNTASVEQGLDDTTAVRLGFYTPATKSFIYYNQQAMQDSLEIQWVEKQVRCCGDPLTFSAIKEVKFNGTVVQPANGVYRFVK